MRQTHLVEQLRFFLDIAKLRDAVHMIVYELCCVCIDPAYISYSNQVRKYGDDTKQKNRNQDNDLCTDAFIIFHLSHTPFSVIVPWMR